MKKLFFFTLLIITFCIKSQPYVTATVQISNPQPCTLCCVGTISATPVSSLCPGAPVQIGIQSSATGTLIQWGVQYLSNLCTGVYTVVVSGMPGPPCDGIVVCYPYYLITTIVAENDKEKFKQVLFYPNPTNGFSYLRSEFLSLENSNLKIINVIGQTLFESKFENKLDLNELENGIYFLQVLENGKLISTQKIVKE